MEKGYRIIYQSFDKNEPNEIIKQQVLAEDTLNIPTNCLDISMGLENQIKLIQDIQDAVLCDKLEDLNREGECPNCQRKLDKFGKHYSTLHDVFSDHNVEIQRMKCRGCGYEAPSTIRTLFGRLNRHIGRKVSFAIH